MEIAAPYQPGSTRRVTVTVDQRRRARTQAEADITVAEPGWTMWMVSHFHYDPVWWNTQGQFTEARLSLPDEDGSVPDVRSAFELVGAHLDKARRDADYKFVLAEIDYLKPYFDAFPQDREDLRRLMAEGRVEIVGGNYNEPNTNLISAEAIIRNAVYGIGFQRDVFGGDPRSAWMLDAFGHDPGYPGLMAAAGLTSSAWARGPFHQWGPSGAEGGDRRMQFGTEFEWISPDGARAAHRVHGAPLRRGLAAAHAAGPAGGRTRGVRAVPRAGAGRHHAQRPAAGRLGSCHPGPLGDRHPPRLEPALRVAQVHHRRAARVLRRRPRRGRFRRARGRLDHPADQGHEPGVHRQGRLLHRHQAGAARDRDRGHRGRTARHPRLAGRRAVPARGAGQGLAAAGLRRPPRRHHRGRVRPGVPGPAGRLARGLGARARPPAATRPPTWPGRAGPDLTVSVVNGLARPRDGMARVTVQVPEDGTRLAGGAGRRRGAGAVGGRGGPRGGRTGRWPR